MRYLYFPPLVLCIAALGLTTTSTAQTRPKAKAAAGVQQIVNPAPVNYWLDVSTGATGGGGGMMGSLMGGMMARGQAGAAAGTGGNAFGNLFGGSNNWFGAANSGAVGPRTDIAIFDRRQAGTVNATQNIPSGMRLGASLALLAPPPPGPRQPRTPFDDRDPEPPQMPDGRIKMTIKAYWGCGTSVRQGQPRLQTFELGGPQGMAMYGSMVQGRFERDRGATSNNKSSIWPNRQSNNAIPSGASLLGDHRVTGAGLPASLAFSIPSAQDFMPELGLRTSGSKAGVLTLNWTNLPTASAYFAAASGMAFREGPNGQNDREMTMITWSASEQPESGMGLIDYISNANQDRYLRDRVILPAGTTSCQIPSGIFQEAMMVTLSSIAYGRELNIVYPQRPENPRVAWNQEWTARVRVKSQSSVMMMGDMTGENQGRSRTSRNGQSPAQPAADLPKCKPIENAAANAAGRAVLGAVTGGIFGGRARPSRERPGIDCTP
jgi:hypothetical protein